MLRFLALFALVLAFAPQISRAQDDSVPISITSPDTGQTYALGSLKQRTLYWDKHDKMLMARVTFTDGNLLDNNSPQDDTLEFRLPGIAFDPAKGIFSATSAKGEVIPIARMKKQLFIPTIEILPNARVRVIHDHGNVSVILEAISPNDPAMHAPPTSTDPNGEHAVGFPQLFN